MAAVAELMHSGVVSPEVTYGMTRVIGSSMARIASALVDAVTAPDPRLDDEDGEPTELVEAPPGEALEPLSSSTGGFLSLFPDVLAQVWRRHLQVAARRRLLRGDAENGPGVVVGFADLVGFTSLAQQVSDRELASVVDRFERIAYDVAVAGGGRVVKMTGDEVIFLVAAPVSPAEIAIGLAAESRAAAGLPDDRAGRPVGPWV